MTPLGPDAQRFPRLGVDEETAELVIGHLPQGMAKTYNLYDRLAERRARSMGGIRAVAGRRQGGADRQRGGGESWLGAVEGPG
jgi:hypothetical protein